ncbi:MAG: hypothetical protein ACOX5Z_08550 [Desulfobulbus sp.]|jgi:hypothetical protein
MIITQETHFFIYGVGGDGIHTLCILSEAGKHVAGFIDQRAAEIGSFRDQPVFTPQEAYAANPHAVVIITIKNVFTHQEVAGSLHAVGFRHIIFKPLAALRGAGSEAERRISALHDTLIVQRICIENGAMLPQSLSNASRIFEDRLEVSKSEADVKAWIPSELIFNYTQQSVVLSEINMPLFFPLVGMYRGLLADDAASKDWREDFFVYASDWLAKNEIPLTPGRAESLLHSRIGVFHEMNRLFEANIPFFIRNAPKVNMPARGRFTMESSGRNRVAFLIAKNFRFIPLSISLEAYEEWNAPAHTAPLMEYLRVHPARLFAPVPHPLFADIAVDFPEYTRLFLLRIAGDMVRDAYKQSIVSHGNLRVFDDKAAKDSIRSTVLSVLLQDGGAASRYFTSLGFACARIVDPAWDNEQILAQHVDRLFAYSVASTAQQAPFLLLDSSASHEVAEPLLDKAHTVYFLQRNDQTIPGCLEKNFCKQCTLFDTFCHSGRITAGRFVRREQA